MQRFFLFTLLFCFVGAQDKDVVVNAKALAKIVIEVNKLKESNKNLIHEIRLLKANTNFSTPIIAKRQFVIPLIICGRKVSPYNTKHKNALLKEIQSNIPQSEVVKPHDINSEYYQEIISIISQFAVRQNKAFWYANFSFLLNRDIRKNLPKNTDIFLKNALGQNVFLFAKRKNNWIPYKGLAYEANIEDLHNFWLKKFHIQKARIYAKFSYDTSTAYPYFPLYFREDSIEKKYNNDLNIEGFPVLQSKIDPESIILLQVGKNTSNMWKFLDSHPSIIVGPCFTFLQNKITHKRKLIFSLPRFPRFSLRQDNISYKYEFEINSQKISYDSIFAKQSGGKIIYELHIPAHGNILRINLGYLYMDIQCNDIYPGRHLEKVQQISLPLLKQYLEKIKDFENRKKVAERVIFSTRFSRESNRCYQENFDPFIEYIRSWKDNISSEELDNLIQKIKDVRDFK